MKIEFDSNQRWQYSLTIKMVLLGVLGLMFLIPLEMIKSVISERQKTSEIVKKEIAEQWSSAQTVSGPVLNIPVKSIQVNKEAEPKISVLHILPDRINITGTIEAEKRYRSIYQAVVYTSALNISGEIIIPPFPVSEGAELLWSEAYYTLGISDNRGLKGNILFKTSRSESEATPGLRDGDLFFSGISFPANIDGAEKSFPLAWTSIWPDQKVLVSHLLEKQPMLRYIPSGILRVLKATFFHSKGLSIRMDLLLNGWLRT